MKSHLLASLGLAGLLGGLALPAAHAAETPPASVAAAPAFDWRETDAYTLGTQAYVYGYSYLVMNRLRWAWIGASAAGLPPTKDYDMPVNTFSHQRKLTTAETKDESFPNNDTLYSPAWLNVGKEPVILCHPDMGSRYFSFELAGIDSDNFDYLGKRTTGSKAACFAIAMPEWKGKLPKGVRLAARATSPWVSALGRTLVNDDLDLPAVYALQDKFTLTPLSYWGKREKPAPSREVLRPFNAKVDPLADWKTLNAVLAENPPPSRDALLLKQFARIGVGAGIDVDKLDDATKRGLARAAIDGRKLQYAARADNYPGKEVNGWSFQPTHSGRAGPAGDFIYRAHTQIWAHDPEEAMYVTAAFDQNKQRIDGVQGNYRLHFTKENLPPANEFWSITVYDGRKNLIANPINRYSIGDRTPGLQWGTDGSLTLYLQKDAPEADKRANWLPIGDQPILAVIRLYGPKAQALKQTWVPPTIERQH